MYDDLAGLLNFLIIHIGSIDEQDYWASFGEDSDLYDQRDKTRYLDSGKFGIVENYNLGSCPSTTCEWITSWMCTWP